MVTGRSREVVGPRRVLPCLGVDESKFARRRKNDDGGAREGWLNFARPAVGEWEALTRLVTSPTHRAPFLCLACRTASAMAGASERLSKCAEVPTNNRLDRAPADVMSRVFHPRFLPSAIGLLPASLGSVRNIRPGKSRYIHHEVIYRDIKRQRRRYGEPCNIVSFCQDPSHCTFSCIFPFLPFHR